MLGLSSGGKEAIGKIVEEIFDRIALQFLGNIPQLRNKKNLFISSQPNMGLANLYVQAMKNQTPNAVERDVLKSTLSSSFGYIESLKQKTMANLTEGIDGLAREAAVKGQKVAIEDYRTLVSEEFRKAKSHLAVIAEQEGTKLRNLGTMMEITRVSSSVGDDDPNVFFVVIKDNVTCKECIKLHLMPDQVTPRLYKLSELKQSYHKRGETSPSAFGLHPFCRCTLTYLTRGFGFDTNGKLTYVEEAHDSFIKQRAK